ncbi:MAG: ATP-binding protein [Actinomycetota bacterium]
MAVREATTNILRHASAGHARIELTAAGPDAVRLVIVNDGAPTADAGTGGTGGTGLAALAERAEAAGGSLTAAQAGGEFTLTLTVPRTEKETA